MRQNYTKNLIYDDTWLILEFGYDAIYYLEGRERGLLIDTGIGGDDLKGFVDAIATKPYDVILTHGHLDHCGGICQFSDVYVNEKDWNMIYQTSNAARKGFVENLREMSIDEVPDQDAATLVEFDADKLPVLHNIEEGDIIDLGGRKISVYSLPGHTQGSICLYDDYANAMFAGDSIIRRLLLVTGPEDYVERLKVWKAAAERVVMSRLDSLRGVYLGHYGRAASSMLYGIYDIARKLIDDISLLDQFDGTHYEAGTNQICLEMNLNLEK